MSPGLFLTLRQRFRDHTFRKFLPKLKIMDKDIDLALYRDPYRSLSITISRNCFHVKKHSALYLDIFQRSKVRGAKIKLKNVNKKKMATARRLIFLEFLKASSADLITLLFSSLQNS
jgi:hypothetical protein